MSAAVLVFKQLDEGSVRAHMISVERAFEAHAPSAAFRLAFTMGGPFSTDATLEIGLRAFKSRMQSRMNASRDLWTSRPLPAEVLMYSAVNPLMCMVRPHAASNPNPNPDTDTDTDPNPDPNPNSDP